MATRNTVNPLAENMRRLTKIGAAAVCLWCVVGLAGMSGCGTEDADDIGSISAKVSFDREVMKYIGRFNVAILYATTASKINVTCADIPRPYAFGNPELRLVGSKSVTWNGQEADAKLAPVAVPANTLLMVAVEGETRYPEGSENFHVVARGCEEGVSYGKGEEATLRVNVTATIGRSCTTIEDCEPTLTACLQGNLFPDGYCTIVGCTKAADCPKGSQCVVGSDQNFCARSCSDSASDCETASGQVCEGRGSFSGCVNVCVHPNWNPNSEC